MTLRIGLLLFPNLTQLDLTGPAEVFGRMPGAEVRLIWKTREPVPCDGGWSILPTHDFAQSDALDLVCVPGGPGQITLMDDAETLDWLRRVARTCRFVTSVCTGSLVLGAAGLLTGRRATCHWASLDQLALLGAQPVPERVVRDGDRITGGGVTSGIDFALAVVAELAGEELARSIQLQIEYDPDPPFASGSPRVSDPDLVATVRQRIGPMLERRRAATERAAARLAEGR